MRKFTDRQNREWILQVNVSGVRAVRDLLGINLYDAWSNGMAVYTSIVGDPVKLVDVIFVLCRDQANAANVTDEDFGRGLWGDSLQELVDAFSAELIDFFPDGQLRALMTQTLAKAAEAVAILKKTAMQAAEQIDSSAIATTLSASSTESPEPSGLIPVP